MKSKKLSLKNLQVESFITSIHPNLTHTIKGGDSGGASAGKDCKEVSEDCPVNKGTSEATIPNSDRCAPVSVDGSSGSAQAGASTLPFKLQTIHLCSDFIAC